MDNNEDPPAPQGEAVASSIATTTEIAAADSIQGTTPEAPQHGAGEIQIKRKRGRPPKRKLPTDSTQVTDSPTVSLQPTSEVGSVKRKRGRPPKRKVVSLSDPAAFHENDPSRDDTVNGASLAQDCATDRQVVLPGDPDDQVIPTECFREEGVKSPVSGDYTVTPTSNSANEQSLTEPRTSRRLASKRESGYVVPWRALMKSPKEEEEDSEEADEEDSSDASAVMTIGSRRGRKRAGADWLTRRVGGRPRGRPPGRPLTRVSRPDWPTGRLGAVPDEALTLQDVIVATSGTVAASANGPNIQVFNLAAACISKEVMEKLVVQEDLSLFLEKLTQAVGVSWSLVGEAEANYTYYLHGDLAGLHQAQQLLEHVCSGHTLEESFELTNITPLKTVIAVNEEPNGLPEEEQEEEEQEEDGHHDGPAEEPRKETEEVEDAEDEDFEVDETREKLAADQSLVMINPTTGERYRRVCAVYTNPEMATVTCEVCDFVTTEKGLLKHKLRKHPQLVFQCEVCLERFGVRYDMRRHRLKHFDASGHLKPELEHSFRKRFPDIVGPITLGVLEEQYTPEEGAIADQATHKEDATDGLNGEVQPPKAEATSKESATAEETVRSEEADKVNTASNVAVRAPAKARQPSLQTVKKIHMCHICDFQGNTVSLHKHKLRSHPKFLYQCPQCPFELGDLMDLARHYVKHDASWEGIKDVNTDELSQNCVCGSCDYKGSATELKAHVALKHPTILSCRHCDITFDNQRTLQHHFRSVHRNLYVCPPKGRRRKKSDLQLPPDVTRCECEVCGQSVRLSWYHQHMKTHNRVTLKCHLCGFETWKRFEMKNHLLIKHGPKRFSCELCGQTFSYKSAKQNHMKNKHAETPQSFKCPHCEKTFSVRRFMLTHVKRMHLKEKKFFCSICNRGFFEKIRMKQHMEVHQPQEQREAAKQFQCSYCQSRFKDQTKLQQHENTHTGNRPYKCKICQKGFAWSSELTNHTVNKHTDERPFRCTVCHKAFKFRYKLTTHMITHTRQSRHACETCGKAFTQRATLKKHRCRMALFSAAAAAAAAAAERGNGGDPVPETGGPQGTSYVKLNGQTEEIYIQVEDAQGTVISSEDLARLGADVEAANSTPQDSEGNTVTFMCGMCQKLFVTAQEINEHVMVEHGESVTLVVETAEQLDTAEQQQLGGGEGISPEELVSEQLMEGQLVQVQIDGTEGQVEHIDSTEPIEEEAGVHIDSENTVQVLQEGITHFQEVQGPAEPQNESNGDENLSTIHHGTVVEALAEGLVRLDDGRVVQQITHQSEDLVEETISVLQGADMHVIEERTVVVSGEAALPDNIEGLAQAAVLTQDDDTTEVQIMVEGFVEEPAKDVEVTHAS